MTAMEIEAAARTDISAGLTLHDGLLNRLRDLINQEDLAPGQKLAERILCERLGISRTPLREALKVLAAEGLVELLPNRGARVTQLTLGDVRALFEVMGALEALAGELAASRIGDAELAEIEALHHQMRAHYLRAELPEYFRLNQSIHERIVAAAGNPVLQATYHGLGMRLKRARYAANLWSKARWDRAMTEHDGLLDALRRRAGAELAAKLKAHLAGKCDAVLAQMTGADAA